MSSRVLFVILQAGLRSIEDEVTAEMHRAISGDLQNDEDMDRAMQEAAEEHIYQVGENTTMSATVHLPQEIKSHIRKTRFIPIIG